MKEQQYQGNKYIHHIAGSMINGVQRCVICGFEIADYRNGMVFPAPKQGDTIQGWAEGDIYFSETKNPTIINTLLHEKDTFINCTDPIK